jgi:hypothetical protein
MSMSFILTSSGLPIPLEACLSSIPRSDLALFLARPSPSKPEKQLRLKSLPITPYPVPIGQQIGVHLFSGLDDGEPVVKLNKRHSLVEGGGSDRERVQRTSSWIGGSAYKRWGVGEMLGYRSYTGQEVEVSKLLFSFRDRPWAIVMLRRLCSNIESRRCSAHATVTETPLPPNFRPALLIPSRTYKYPPSRLPAHQVARSLGWIRARSSVSYPVEG